MENKNLLDPTTANVADFRNDAEFSPSCAVDAVRTRADRTGDHSQRVILEVLAAILERVGEIESKLTRMEDRERQADEARREYMAAAMSVYERR